MSSSNNNPSASSASASGGVNTGVAVGVPILIIAVTAVIILGLVLGFMYYRSRRRPADIDTKGVYAPLPLEEDSGSASSSRSPHKTVSYRSPPTISLADPPNPNMQFTMATQLTDSTKTGQRYPFMDQHKPPEGRNLRDTRPLNKRTKKRGSHRHGHNRHEVLKSGSVDTSSDVSDHSSSGVSSEVRPRSRNSPMASSLSPSEHEDVNSPMEIYLTLGHKKDLAQFIVSIDRIVPLPSRPGGTPVDSYVRLILVPKLADRLQKKTVTIFSEDIVYESVSREELINSSLTIEVMDSVSHDKHQLLGQAVIELADISFVDGDVAMKLRLSQPEVRESRGTVNLSISYSPDNKRLSVIILRAKDLNKGNYKETDPQAKLWVTQNGERVLCKLRTRRKQQSSGPIFNEVLNCTIDPSKISGVSINVALTNEHKAATHKALGQVTLCSQSTGNELRHWNDVMATPGKPIADWHELR